MAGQWRSLARFGAAPLWLGLDYTAAEAGWRMAGIEMTAALFTQVQLVEAGAVKALNAER